jgi:Caspase domain
MTGYFIGFGLNYVDPDKYNGWDGELRAAENDIKFYTDFAASNGFKTIGSFLGEKATRDSVRKALQNAVNFASEGDTVFIAYSGHGNQYKKGTKLYEAYCLYDGQFTEQELRNIISSFRDGVKVVVVLDCCHSGGFDRDMIAAKSMLDDFIPKSMPKDISIMLDPLDYKGEIAHKKSVVATKSKLIKWLVACEKAEVAYDGTKHGLFTAAFVAKCDDVGKRQEGLSAKEETITYAMLMSRIASLCEPHQHPLLKNTHKSKKFNDSELIFKI